jgi:hypothetical protein
MQLQVNTETKVNDNVTLYTRCNILDKILSSQSTNEDTADYSTNIQFDRAWMDVKTPVGLFRIGRKEGIKWGTDFFDDGKDWGTDRVEYFLPIPVGDDKFVIGLVGEKALETQTQNRDNEKFYITGTYINKDFRTGLLVGYYDYRTMSAEAGTDSTTIDAATTAFTSAATLPDMVSTGTTLVTELASYTPRMSSQFYYVAPYFSGKIGPISINAEFDYISGKAQLRPNASAVAAIAALDASLIPAFNDYGTLFTNAYKEKDINMMAYWVEAGFTANPATINVGYAFLSGDKDRTSGDLEGAAYLAPCADWGKVFILTSGMGIHGTNAVPGFSNITNRGSAMNWAGLSMPYIAGKVAASDSLTLGALFAYAQADDEPAGYDGDYGMETDLTLSWKFLGNLEYKATAAYLMTGDFFKYGTTAKVGDMITLYHQIILTF